ncbi:MAG: ATP-binding cassette domain-containing protein [Acidimicrobiales bacterium]
MALRWRRPRPASPPAELVPVVQAAGGAVWRRVDDRLEQLNVPSDLWYTYPTLLSGGEQQRVNLAAATLAPPRLLLLDEPVSALDPANRAAAMALVDDLVARGVGVLAVFHDTEAMRRHASEVVLLGNGAVLASGPPAEVLGSTQEEAASA